MRTTKKGKEEEGEKKKRKRKKTNTFAENRVHQSQKRDFNHYHFLFRAKDGDSTIW